MNFLNLPQVKNKLLEGVDFYFNELGFMVFTSKYHLERGFCCGNGCRHCPFNYEGVAEPKRSELLQNRVGAVIDHGTMQNVYLRDLFIYNKPFCSRYSAICTALVAAPLRRLSLTIHMFSVFGWLSSLRNLPTKTSSFSCAHSGIG